jgi:hypothetical protein
MHTVTAYFLRPAAPPPDQVRDELRDHLEHLGDKQLWENRAMLERAHAALVLATAGAAREPAFDAAVDWLLENSWPSQQDAFWALVEGVVTEEELAELSIRDVRARRAKAADGL